MRITELQYAKVWTQAAAAIAAGPGHQPKHGQRIGALDYELAQRILELAAAEWGVELPNPGDAAEEIPLEVEVIEADCGCFSVEFCFDPDLVDRAAGYRAAEAELKRCYPNHAPQVSGCGVATIVDADTVLASHRYLARIRNSGL